MTRNAWTAQEEPGKSSKDLLKRCRKKGEKASPLGLEAAAEDAAVHVLEEVLESSRVESMFLIIFESRNCCAKGMECTFAHSVEELKELPDLRRTSLCKQRRGQTLTT